MSRHRKIIVFIGPPGAGKGTLSQIFVDRLHCKQLSTGNLFRKHIAERTELGKSIDLAMKSGKLVSDDSVIAMVIDWLIGQSDDSTPVILDGFPRTRAQAAALDRALEHLSIDTPFAVTVFKMELSDAEAMHRILGRLVCSRSSCQAVYSVSDHSMRESGNLCSRCGDPLIRRSDDVLEAIGGRLLVYRQHEQEIIEYYRSYGALIVSVAMNRDPETIFNEVQQRLIEA